MSGGDVPDVLRQAVVVERWVKATPQTVFGFLTEPDKWTRRQGTRADLDPRPGGIYRVHIRAGGIASGQFLEVEPYRRVVFTWGFEIPDHPIPPGSTLVQIDLIPDGDNTLIRLTQDHVPPVSAVPVRRGWDDYLAILPMESFRSGTRDPAWTPRCSGRRRSPRPCSGPPGRQAVSGRRRPRSSP